MAVAAVSSVSTASAPSSSQDSIRQAFGQMVSALQSGNITAAQSAYSTLSQAGNSNPNSPLSQALAQIGSALQSGNIGQAQQALAALQQQLLASRGGHMQPAAAPADASGTSTPAASSNQVNVTA